ncbi:hypothetical protein E2C01_006151 [Portunus trituberculatus]|uniref:Uncharacterized protein n=1 Tax=Portunus trituberculatus TaxID=210409 RepID=A0A5B7CVJ0_PORTR|nr:hypothetical protein [Portunus trituberculatus]
MSCQRGECIALEKSWTNVDMETGPHERNTQAL